MRIYSLRHLCQRKQCASRQLTVGFLQKSPIRLSRKIAKKKQQIAKKNFKLQKKTANCPKKHQTSLKKQSSFDQNIPKWPSSTSSSRSFSCSSQSASCGAGNHEWPSNGSMQSKKKGRFKEQRIHKTAKVPGKKKRPNQMKDSQKRHLKKKKTQTSAEPSGMSCQGYHVTPLLQNGQEQGRAASARAGHWNNMKASKKKQNTPKKKKKKKTKNPARRTT